MKLKQKFYDPYRDGVTQSLLSMWLECRQKALYCLQGYTPKGVSASMTQGTVGHGVLQFVYEAMSQGKLKGPPNAAYVSKVIDKVEKIWKAENPRASRQALQDLELAGLHAMHLLPIYFDYWKDDFKKLVWLSLEMDFKVPLPVKNGKIVPVRGKMDGVFKRSGVWLFETKFKGMINEGNILDTLSLDLQVNLYLWALYTLHGIQPSGVLYNVVRRPGLSQGKKETFAKFCTRLAKDINNRPDWYFYRFEVSTDKDDMRKWTAEFEPMMEEFLAWWEGLSGHYRTSNACVSKYGRCWGLSPCAENNFHNLTKRKTVFRELEDL